MNNKQDIIDSREIIDRINELTLERTLSDYQMSDEAEEELATLTEFAKDAEAYAPDWKYGVTLIHVNYFEEHIKEYVQDIGMLPDNMPDWLNNNIDWSGVADDLVVDYSEIDFDGESYYIR